MSLSDRSEDPRITALKAKAAAVELAAVDFLDAQGEITDNPRRRPYVAIRMTFIDGEQITLPRYLERHFLKQQFTLRPARNDA